MADKYLEAGAMGATAAGAGGAAYLAGGDKRKQKKADKARQDRRNKVRKARKDKTVSMRNQANAEVAQSKLDRLQKIKPSDLNDKNKKVRKALIQEQKNIIKGATKSTAKEIAKKVGLRSIPVIGAFLTAFESTPAYSRGGVVKKKK
jgi:uncharacterized protein YcbK (DUF882 family)